MTITIELITGIAGCIIALSNTTPVKAWMQQRGLRQKSSVEIEILKITQKNARYEERLATLEESLIRCNNEKDDQRKQLDKLNNLINDLTEKTIKAECESVALKEQQEKNVATIVILQEENEKLWAEINKRGGMLKL